MISALMRVLLTKGFWIVTKSPTHPALCGEESDLIADLELEVAQTNKLERTSEAGMSAHCQQVELARCGARDFDP